MEARIDWSAMVFDLERCGMSQREIGEACESSHVWVNNLKNIPGTQPKFHQGALLLGLWADRTGADASAAPREAIR